MDLNAKVTAVLIGVIAVTAAVTDFRAGTIYNWLTLPVLALAPIWHFVTRGLPGLWSSLEGFGITAGILVALALVAGRGLGGGDLKLLSALAALGGHPYALWMLVFTALSGPVVAVPAMVRRRIVGYTLRNLAMNVATRYAAGQRDVSVGQGSLGGKLPYGICIALGALIALFYPGLHW
jgi:prepilin peptidase CpaA